MKKTVAILLSVIIIAAIGICVYFSSAMGIDAGNGIYYSQKNSGYYIQFKKDNTFVTAYNPQKDAGIQKEPDNNIQAYIDRTGTWEKDGENVILTFNDNSNMTLVIKDDYLYNPRNIYKGKFPDGKFVNAIYKNTLDDERYYSVIFYEDNTMTYVSGWGKSSKATKGTYVKTDNIITARYDGSADIAHKFLIIDEGLVEDIYIK